MADKSSVYKKKKVKLKVEDVCGFHQLNKTCSYGNEVLIMMDKHLEIQSNLDKEKTILIID